MGEDASDRSFTLGEGEPSPVIIPSPTFNRLIFLEIMSCCSKERIFFNSDSISKSGASDS